MTLPKIDRACSMNLSWRVIPVFLFIHYWMNVFSVPKTDVCTDEQVGEGAVGYVHSRKTKRYTEYSTQSLVLLPGTVLCRSYGSIEKSYEAAASYGAKEGVRVESGKLKVESGK
ncbi:hypothetical protein EZS27_002913 [termite gut metagenome]|uniref:Uncharacterized protein n=1 Tax=termite gut metagenome TaxID=433724 RepID=A0A5J4SWU6_9ZZZZ